MVQLHLLIVPSVVAYLSRAAVGCIRQWDVRELSELNGDIDRYELMT